MCIAKTLISGFFVCAVIYFAGMHNTIFAVNTTRENTQSSFASGSKKVPKEANSNQTDYNISFVSIFESAFKEIADKVLMRIQKISDMSEVSIMDSCLYEFALRNDINQGKYDYIVEEMGDIHSIEEIFGNDFQSKVKENEKINRFIGRMNDKGYTEKTIVKNNKKIDFLIRGTLEFKSYLKRNEATLDKIPQEDRTIIAILNDRNATDTDIIFTLNKVYVTGWFNIKDYMEYHKIEPTGKDNKLKIGTHSYGYKDVDMAKLYELIDLFAEVANEFIDDNKSLGIDIQNKIIEEKIIYENILINGY